MFLREVSLQRQSFRQGVLGIDDAEPSLAIQLLRLQMRGHENVVIREHHIDPAMIEPRECILAPGMKLI